MRPWLTVLVAVGLVAPCVNACTDSQFLSRIVRRRPPWPRRVVPERAGQFGLRPSGEHTDAGKKIVHVFRDYRLSTAYSTAVS